MIKQGVSHSTMILRDQTIIHRLLYLALLVLISFPLVTSGDDKQNDADDEEKVIFINDDENVFGVDSKNQLNVGSAGKLPVWDPFGYVMYCPCMGRFGNQAEQFLGSIAFAKALNRTLVVPPWRTYKNVPYDEFFKYEELQKAHKVILMEEFMEYLAPSHWQPGQRLGYCWLPRNSDQKCQMKKGSPFGPFWDAFNVDFDELVSYHVSSYVSGSEKDFSAFREEWNSQFPVSEHPVLAFKGAPASFPVHPENRKYHQYMKWSDSIMSEVNAHIQQLFQGESFVGIHLRNGMDWDRACNHAEGRHNLMASPQCLERGQLLTRGMCYPTTPSILETTKAVVMKIQAKHVFIATDHDPLEEELNDFLKPIQVKVHYLKPALPQIDLAILGEADYFIGNCVSSFTSFVKRARDTSGEDRPTMYWGFDVE